jgi:hypothetical protein
MSLVPGMKEGLSLFGLPAGQETQRAERLLSLPCRIAAWRRSSRSSALLYPPPCNTILSLGFFYAENGLVFKIKMGLFSRLILIFTTV